MEGTLVSHASLHVATIAKNEIAAKHAPSLKRHHGISPVVMEAGRPPHFWQATHPFDNDIYVRRDSVAELCVVVERNTCHEDVNGSSENLRM